MGLAVSELIPNRQTDKKKITIVIWQMFHVYYSLIWLNLMFQREVEIAIYVIGRLF